MMFQYAGSVLVTGSVSILMKYLKYYTFLIFMAMATIAFIFSLLCIKETKGLSLEDMENLYSIDKKVNPKLRGDQDIKRDIDNAFDIKKC